MPLSFAVRVREDLTLNQLRLSIGRPWLSDDEVRQTHLEEPILYRAGAPVPVDELVLSNGLFLGLDLRGDENGQVGHSTRDSAPLLDLTSGGEVDPLPFWDPVFREDGDRLVLSPKRFYLLMSNEAVSIPPNMAAEMTAYDPTSGELRTHYAGFFDPGFGFDPIGWLPRLARRARGARPRRPLHGRERSGGVQADLRTHAGGADLALRVRHRVLLSATRRDAESLLPPLTGVVARRRAATHTGSRVEPRATSRVHATAYRQCSATARNRVNSGTKAQLPMQATRCVQSQLLRTFGRDPGGLLVPLG